MPYKQLAGETKASHCTPLCPSGRTVCMAGKMESHGGSKATDEPARGDRARMQNGYGRESVGHPDETGIRRGEGMMHGQPDVDTDQEPPSRQTSTAKDISGQA